MVGLWQPSISRCQFGLRRVVNGLFEQMTLGFTMFYYLFGGFLSNFLEANYLIPGDCFFSRHLRTAEIKMACWARPSISGVWMENQKQLWDSLDFHRDHFSSVSVYPPSHRNLCGFPCESCPFTGGIILSLLHPAPLWVGSSPAKNGGTPEVPASPASTPPTTVTWSSYQWWFSWDLMGISWWFFGIYMDLWWFMMIWWFD